jgi:hypothetical protein
MPDAPLDPRFVRFRDGWERSVVGRPPQPGLRWAPQGHIVGAPETRGVWAFYKPSRFEFIDPGAKAFPASPLETRFNERLEAIYVWRWDFLPAFAMPGLFADVESAYGKIGSIDEGAIVWNPYDGSWRVARLHVREDVPPDGTSPGDDPDRSRSDPPQELVDRIKQVAQLERDGFITKAQAKDHIAELLREYI